MERVDQEQGRYVVVCSCGWRSTPDTAAQHVCTEWESHREQPQS